MGPDEPVSREEFLTTLEYLMTELNYQRMVLRRFMTTAMKAEAISSAQLDAMISDINSASEHEEAEASFAKLTAFGEMRSVVERYRGDFRREDDSTSP
jgi:hypothetical protein